MKTVTLTNKNPIDMTLGTPTVSAPFALDPGTTNCTAILTKSGGSCTVGIVFEPTAKGTQHGTLTITDDAVHSPQTVRLTGHTN